MSIEALILGKLHKPAERRTSQSGRVFVTASVRTSTGEAESCFVNAVTFSDSAGTALLALSAGDAVALAGTLTPKAWTDREGHARPSLDMVAAQVLTVYGVRKKRAAVAAAAKPAPEPEGFGRPDDEAWLRGGAA